MIYLSATIIVLIGLLQSQTAFAREDSTTVTLPFTYSLKTRGADLVGYDKVQSILNYL